MPIAAGQNHQIQYNTTGSLNADTNLLWINESQQMQLSGSINQSTIIIKGNGDGPTGTYGTLEIRGTSTNNLLATLGSGNSAESQGYMVLFGNNNPDPFIGEISFADRSMPDDKRTGFIQSVWPGTGGGAYELRIGNRIDAYSLVNSIIVDANNDTNIQGNLNALNNVVIEGHTQMDDYLSITNGGLYVLGNTSLNGGLIRTTDDNNLLVGGKVQCNNSLSVSGSSVNNPLSPNVQLIGELNTIDNTISTTDKRTCYLQSHYHSGSVDGYIDRYELRIGNRRDTFGLRDVIIIDINNNTNIVNSLFITGSFSSDNNKIQTDGLGNMGLLGGNLYVFGGSIIMSPGSALSGSASYAKHAGIADSLSSVSKTINQTGSYVTIIERPTGSFNSAFFNFLIQSGSNSRAGLFVGNWINNTVTYVETGVPTPIGTTTSVDLKLNISSSNVQLLARSTGNIGWIVKATATYV